MDNNYTKGSEWRKWDLHIHSPYTFMNKYSCSNEDFINKVLEEELTAIGLTNYFKFSDQEFILKEELEKKGVKVFLNLEFRLDYQNKDDDCLDLHIIFSNDVNTVDINKLLQNITVNVSGVNKKCSDLNTNDHFKNAVVNYDHLREMLEDESLNLKEKYIIGFLSRGKGNARSSSNYGKIEKTADLLIHSSDNDKNVEQDREFWLGYNKPLLQSSDAHTLKNIGSKFSWIKSDPTFEGLKQIIYEPEDRVFLGKEPIVLDRVKSNKTKYISSLSINNKMGKKAKKGKWFQNVDLPLNSELVAIIGNKGSGKSAISDILGVLGDTHNAGVNHKNLSFLNNSKHKRFRQKGFSENFEAKLIWKDATSIEISLDKDIDITQTEKVKYLPQNYFESLTNSLEEEGFEKTLKSVIFLHISESDRHRKNTFEELEEYKSASIQKDLPLLENDIEEISIEIINLEKRKHPSYKKGIENLLREKEKELSEHEKNKPIEVENPASDKSLKVTKEKEKQLSSFNKLNKELSELDTKLTSKNIEKNKTVLEKEDLQQISNDLERFRTQINAYIEDNKIRFEKYGFDVAQVIESKFDIRIVNRKIKDKEFKLQSIETSFKTLVEIEIEFKDEPDKINLAKKESLICKRKLVEEQVVILKKELSKPEREYQDYKEKLNKWKKIEDEIKGSSENPKTTPKTVEFYKQEKKFIENELAGLLFQNRSKRIGKSLEIFEKKQEIIKLYEEFKKSIDDEIKKDKEFRKKFKMDINVSFKINGKFITNFLNFINKGKKGTFYGRVDGEKYLSKIFDEKDLTNKDDITNVLKTIIDYLEIDQRPEIKKNDQNREISDQVEQIEDFYSFIFSLNFLEELSPGEKGSLLLVFYLMIDKEDTPLIIDQPEDNLDNKSVFEVLTHFIRFAKKRRQIIIVTHNPNLAIGADAEQIIHVNLNKKKNYEFTYQSGSIENPIINQKVVEILEGTRPAFDKRKIKYLK